MKTLGHQAGLIPVNRTIRFIFYLENLFAANQVHSMVVWHKRSGFILKQGIHPIIHCLAPVGEILSPRLITVGAR